MVFPQEYRKKIGGIELENASIEELLDFQEKAITDSGILKLTKKSPIYKKKWKKVKSKFDTFQLDDLNSLPYITDDDVGKYSENINKTVMTTPRHWLYDISFFILVF